MSRKYQNIKQYEEEIFELKEQGLTYAQIGEYFGIERIYIKKFFERYRVKQRKIEAGIAIKKRGRQPKDYVVREEDKIAELRYIIARKDAKIKALEMEKELLRDFLSLTERK